MFPVDYNGHIDWSQPLASYAYDSLPHSWTQEPQVGETAFNLDNSYPGISDYQNTRGTYQLEAMPFMQMQGTPSSSRWSISNKCVGLDAVNHMVHSGQRHLSMGSGLEHGANYEVHEDLRRSISPGSISSGPPRISRISGTHPAQPQSQFRSGLSRPSALQLERINRAVDCRYSEVAGRIVNIMGDTQVSCHDERLTASNTALQLQVLNTYIQSLSSDLQTWVCGYRPLITSPSHQERSKDKRKSGGSARLYFCLWCNNTFTMKHNLANHVRSHLDLHISFCQHCDFSSVCSSLPTRHQCSR
ncbi:hypothetical protein BJ165DRAFT_1488545 [Panaeolus papilionaceus]|nr:hypothetical protein BJ165DRAFT_1488545 [Panaeolus papilionaceus]